MTESEQTATCSALEEEDIEAIIDKLDEHNIKADREIGEDASDESSNTPENASKRSSTASDAAEDDTPSSHVPKIESPNASAKPNGSVEPTDKATDTDIEKKTKNPFKFLKRLSSSGKDKAEREKEELKNRKEKLDKVLTGVKVDTLPQTFVTKYLGNQPSKGLYGIKFTREPVEALVSKISNAKKGVDLPLFSIQVSTRGLLIAPHKANKSQDIPIDMGLLPIEFISYGVQDVKYTRIFSYIVVREMSSKSKVLECHALLCDSVVTARRLALSMALAFREYARTLQGKPYKFKVDLRAPAEVEKDLEDAAAERDKADAEEEEDCEA